MYIFNENMDGKLLQGILGTHLVESAELHFDVEHAEQWWLLQDNDPKHKSCRSLTTCPITHSAEGGPCQAAVKPSFHLRMSR